MAEKKYLDLTGLETLVGKINAKITEDVSSLKNNATVGYDTLKGLEDKLKEEVNRAKEAEGKNASAIAALESSAADLIESALEELTSAVTGEGTLVTSVTQESGKVTVGKGSLASADKTVTINGLDLAVNIDETTIVKDASTGKLSVAASVAALSGEKAISVEDKTVKLTIAESDKVLSQDENGLLANLELKYTKAADGANGKIELVGKNGQVIGTAIDTSDFTADGFLDKVEWKGDGSNILVFTWNTAAGKQTATEIDLTKYIDTYLNGDGLALDSDTKTFSIKVKEGDKYLTVGEDGLASNGIDDAIAAAIANLASQASLNTEIAARKAVTGQDGDTYTANSSVNYIGTATSLNDADVKLDAELKKVNDSIENLTAADVTATALGGDDYKATTVQGILAELKSSIDKTVASAVEVAAEEVANGPKLEVTQSGSKYTVKFVKGASLADYGIADAKIEGDTITLGTQTMTLTAITDTEIEDLLSKFA